MRLALQALFRGARDLSEDGVRLRAKIENELRNNPRSAEFYRKLELSVSDPRLKAPEIFGVESFPDSNIVAEYLDATLESLELSDEYEKLCLERPEALAEVGDCYDILNNRLAHATKAPANCRRRLYNIALEDERPESATVAAENDERESLEDATANVVEEETTSEGENVLATVEKAPLEPETKKKRGRKTVADLGKKTVSFGAKSILALLVTIGGLRIFAATRARLMNDATPSNEIVVVDATNSQTQDQGTVSSSGFHSVPSSDVNPVGGSSANEPPKLARDFDEQPAGARPQRWNDFENEESNDPGVEEDRERIVTSDELRNPMTIPYQSNDVFDELNDRELQ